MKTRYYKHQAFGSFKVRVPHPRRVTTETGFTTVYNPETQENVKLFIDVEAIVNQIGVRAIRSKSGRAKYMHGAIIVTKEVGK